MAAYSTRTSFACLPLARPFFPSRPKFSRCLLDFKIKIVNWSLTAGGFIEKIKKEKIIKW